MKTCDSEFGGLLWRHLTPQRKMAHNYSPSGAQRYFGKFTFCMTFGAHKLVRSERFWTTYTKFDNCCQRYSDMRKKNLCRCTSTFPALNYCWDFFQITQLSIRTGVHKLFRRFLDFPQFLTAISQKLWRHLATK